MNKKNYEPIPDVDAYLKRINIERPEKCTVDYLDKLIVSHQYNIPFENLDVFDFHKIVDITIEKVFDKIVNQKRGGYCFELNAAFCRLLNTLGYDAYPCLARVVMDSPDIVPSLHRVNVVRIENELYVCDVGFGGVQPSFALKLQEDFTKTSSSGVEQTYKMSKDGEWWGIYYKTKDSWLNTIQFMDIERDEVEFKVPNFFCSKHEESRFVKERVLNLKTEDGSKSILDYTFAEIKNHVRKETPINNDEELKEILKLHFGIVI